MPAILEHLKDHAVQYRSKKILYYDDEAEGFITRLINDHLVLVCCHDGIIVGLISGMIMPHAYTSRIKTLVENFWWVTEEYRNTKAASLLLNEFIRYGRQNVDWIVCATQADGTLKDQSFIRKGFVLKEKSFLMEV